MIQRALNSASLGLALMQANIKGYAAEFKKILFMSLFMMIQNSMFLVLWLIFFQTVSSINGWQFQDIARLFGIAASFFGIGMTLFNGARSLPRLIATGEIYFYLTKPRHPLPAIMTSSMGPASLGDALYGPLIWAVAGNMDANQWLIIIIGTLLASMIFVAIVVSFYSTSFWMKGNTRFADQLFEMFIIAGTNVLRGQPFGVKIIVFTVLPAGFTTLLPTMLVREFSWTILGILASAVVVYWLIAIAIFNAGVKHYKTLS